MIELGNHPDDDIYITYRELLDQKIREKRTARKHLMKECLHDMALNGKEAEKCLNRNLKKIQAALHDLELEAAEELARCLITIVLEEEQG